jgi:hypothetical protein
MATKLILDANLSILFVVGITKRDYIAKHKRLRPYDEVDFDNISNLIANSDGVIFTPNVLSETSNLIRYIGDPIKSEVSMRLGAIIAAADERVIESKIAVMRSEYVRLGLTDAVLLELACFGATLLTIDLDLYLAALAAGLNAINYNHIKELRPDFQ